MRVLSVAVLCVFGLRLFSIAQTNDQFANRLILTGGNASGIGNMQQASTEPGEPIHAGAAGSQTLWWSWTAPATGVVNFSAHAPEISPSGSARALAVYTGASLGTLSEVGSIAAAFNGPFNSSAAVAPGPSVSLQVTAGTAYQIALLGIEGAGSGVVALNIDEPPTIISNATATGTRDAAFTYTALASGSPISFEAAGLPTGLSINRFDGRITGVPRQSGVFSVGLQATNSAGTTAGTLMLTLLDPGIIPATSLPSFSGTPAGVESVVGASFNANLRAAGSSIRYTAAGLPPGLTIDAWGTIRGTATEAGVFPVSISATNAAGVANAIVTITIRAVVQPPEIQNYAFAEATLGTALNLQIMTAGVASSFSATDLPPGLSCDVSSGRIRGTPTTAGVYQVPISASNEAGTRTAVLTMTVKAAAAVDSRLRVTSSAGVNGRTGSFLTYRIVANGNPTAFAASGLPTGLSLNAQTGTISGTPKIAGSYPVLVTISGADGAMATATVIFKISTFPTVAAPPRTYVLVSSAGAAATVGQAFSYWARFSESNDRFPGSGPSSFTVLASGLPPGLSVSNTSGTIAGTPTTAGIYRVHLSGMSTYAPESVTPAVLTIRVDPPGGSAGAPLITSPATVSGTVGAQLGSYITASNRPTSYAASGLPAGLIVSTSSGYISGTPTETGSFPVLISATDGAGTMQATVNFVIGSGVAPVLNSDAAASGMVGASFSHYFSSDTSGVTFSISNLPPGLSFSQSNRSISGTPTTAGTFQVPVSVIHSSGTSEQTLVIEIRPLKPPIVSGDAVETAVVGQQFYTWVYGTNSPTSFTASNLPPGVILGAAGEMNRISGIPTTAGTFVCDVRASNASGTGQAKITFIIQPAAAPAFGSDKVAVQHGSVGSYLSNFLSAANAASYAAPALPPGLTLNSHTGQISGTPTQPGTFSIPVSASNAGGTTPATLTFVIAPAPAPPEPPVITSSAGTSGSIGGSFSYAISATNSPTTFAVSGLPAGLALAPSTGVISGRPTVAGTFAVAVSAANAAGTGRANVMLEVAGTPSSPPIISSSATANASVGGSFHFPISASNSPTAFEASGLPPGVNLDSSTGVLSGVPTAVGSFPVALRASNSFGSGSAKMTLVVSAGADAPRFTSLANVSAVRGLSFVHTLAATLSPTSFTAPSLPPGLTLNAAQGTISGVPTLSGTYTVNVTASTSRGTATGTLNIRIDDSLSSRPAISCPLHVDGATGDSLGFFIGANDSATTYTVSQLPAGLTLDPTSGLISGIPLDSGTFQLNISASNSGGSNTATVKLRLASLSRYHFASSAGALAVVGGEFRHRLIVLPSPERLVVLGQLPKGLTFDSATREIVGIPLEPGEFEIHFSAARYSSSLPAASSAVLALTILREPISPPVFFSSPVAKGSLAADFSYSPRATNRPHQFSAINLPEGLTLDPNTGAIRGRPTQTGEFTVGLTATNTVGTAHATLIFTFVALPPPPAITSGLVATAQEGVNAVSYRIAATNEPGAYQADGLPPGLSLDPVSGAISGVPSTLGTFVVPISATNAAGTATATVTFTIAAKSPPVITATTGAMGTVGNAFSYTFSFFDTVTSTQASGLPPGLFYDAGSKQIYGVPTAAGTYHVSFTVDDRGRTATAIISIIIAALPEVPSIKGVSFIEAGTVGETFSLDFSYFDSTARTYQATGLPPGLSVDTVRGEIVGSPTSAGVFPVILSATNAAGTTNLPISLRIAAAPSLAHPRLMNALGATAAVGQAFRFQLFGAAAASYRASGLPAGLSLNAASGLISGIPTSAGDFDATVTATNAVGTSTATLRIAVSGTGSAPVITSQAALVVRSESSLYYYYPFPEPSGSQYQITATNEPVSFLASGLPDGLSLNLTSGMISGTPRESGIFQVLVSATNSAGTGNAIVTFSIEASAVTVAGPANELGTVGTYLSRSSPPYFPPSFYSTPSLNVPQYSAIGLPPGLSLNVTTGEIRGVPTVAGTYLVHRTVTNLSARDSGVITFLIAEAEPSPEVVPAFTAGAAAISGTLHVPLTYEVKASGSPTSFHAGSLPPGLRFSTSSETINGVPRLTGKVTGRPTAPGTYTVPISARNAAGFASIVVTFKVSSSLPPHVISSSAAFSGSVGTSLKYQISSSLSVSGAPTSYSAGSLPLGLSLDSSAGVISGTPLDAGTFLVPISKTVSGSTASAILTLVIESSPAPSRPTVCVTIAPRGYVGVPLSLPVAAGKFSDDLVVSSLPPGLTFGRYAGSNMAVISGVPTTAGTHLISLVSENGAGRSEARVTLSILTPQAVAPTISTHPIGAIFRVGDDAVLTAVASGSPAPSVQWFHENRVIPGATSTTLQLADLKLEDSGRYWLVARNSSGTAVTQSATITVRTDFSRWQQANFSSPEIAAGRSSASYDFNGDGTANLLDYAIGRNPRTGLGGMLPTSDFSAAGLFQITFTRDTSVPDLTYRVSASDDLQTWTPIATSAGGGPMVSSGNASLVSESSGVVRTVTVQDVTSGFGGMQRFLKLEVTREP